MEYLMRPKTHPSPRRTRRRPRWRASPKKLKNLTSRMKNPRRRAETAKTCRGRRFPFLRPRPRGRRPRWRKAAPRARRSALRRSRRSWTSWWRVRRLASPRENRSGKRTLSVTKNATRNATRRGTGSATGIGIGIGNGIGTGSERRTARGLRSPTRNGQRSSSGTLTRRRAAGTATNARRKKQRSRRSRRNRWIPSRRKRRRSSVWPGRWRTVRTCSAASWSGERSPSRSG
mmetsp:Transcript_18503/g.35215  ORF Transcript_18503/g.35215 Transcript_18503/m.35215 type:complete len:231 (+) Transcript_18503:778-1470(+)